MQKTGTQNTRTITHIHTHTPSKPNFPSQILASVSNFIKKKSHHNFSSHPRKKKPFFVNNEERIFYLFFFFLSFSFFLFFYFSLKLHGKNSLKNQKFEATAQVQAGKWAFARRESSVDSRRFKVDDIRSESAAQQAIERDREGEMWWPASGKILKKKSLKNRFLLLARREKKSWKLF